jgi:hypothetical protein
MLACSLSLHLLLCEQVVKQTPHTALALASAYRHLAAAQAGLKRTEDAVASLQSGVEVTMSPLLQQAVQAARDNATDR